MPNRSSEKLREQKPVVLMGDTRDGHHRASGGNSHRTLWFYKDANPHEYFVVIGRLDV